MEKTILVAGASGITGSYIAQSLRALPSTDGAGKVLTLSRGGEADLKADLTNPASVNSIVNALTPVTHIFYTAFAGGGPGRDWGALTELNTGMFTNLLDAVQANSPHLRRIILMQGQKYYGTHLGPFKTPARESDPRHAGENFYFNQEDLLAKRCAAAHSGNNWDYVCLRPHMVCGHNDRAPQNPISVLSQFAYLKKQAGEALNYPGPEQAYGRVNQATDANLLAKSARWAMDAPGIGGEAFNIINGDYIRWQLIWPILANVFDMPLGEVVTQDLTKTMPALGKRFLPTKAAPDWGFGNYMLGCTWDVMGCTLKARKFGFNDFQDTQEMYRELFEQARVKLEALATN
ncbi:MAG: NAD-dependent epimerase/dehydratase family protein [Burkholderiaceae bacterium]